MAFLTEFQIDNRSGERVFVTCAGARELGGLGTLPRYRNRFPPALPLPAGLRDEPVEAGGIHKVIYDWDDTNFNWILVRGERGPYRVIETPNARRDTCCWSNSQAVYEIPPLSQLPEAPVELLRQVGLDPPQAG
jgi:hypothetical protein